LVAVDDDDEAQDGGVLPTPKVLLPSEVLVAAAAGNFYELIGAKETDQVDFKEHAYNLDVPKDKQDLTADVAELANARGGVLVLGVRTVVHANGGADHSPPIAP
jgi:hypothetical protein